MESGWQAKFSKFPSLPTAKTDETHKNEFAGAGAGRFTASHPQSLSMTSGAAFSAVTAGGIAALKSA
jgi:hypothetical protein